MDRAVKNLTDQSKTPIFNNTKSARFRPTRAAAGGMVRKSRTTIDDDDKDYGVECWIGCWIQGQYWKFE